MNSNFNYNLQDQTAFKPSQKQSKGGDVNNHSFYGNNLDSTVNTTMNNTNTNMKLNFEMRFDSPYLVSKSLNNLYDNTIRTPIKKTKRRDCTPLFSPDEIEEDNEYSSSTENKKYIDCPRGVKNTQKFLDKLNMNDIMENNTENFKDISRRKDGINLNCSDILEGIRGNLLLNSLECDGSDPDINKKAFTSIVKDSELFNKITNLVCDCLIEGFNHRMDIFFELLSPAICLEILDHPLNSFNNNLTLLINHVISLNPDFSTYQIDLYPDDSRFIFSLGGKCLLSSPNNDILNFILSFRVNLHLSDSKIIRSNLTKIREVISVDYIRIKIYNDNCLK